MVMGFVRRLGRGWDGKGGGWRDAGQNCHGGTAMGDGGGGASGMDTRCEGKWLSTAWISRGAVVACSVDVEGGLDACYVGEIPL